MDELDLETQAIADITKALSQLEPEVIQRVLKYLMQRYQPKLQSTPSPDLASSDTRQVASSSFNEFHELFDAANPASSPDKALIAAYWFQVVLDHEELDGFLLNKELKNLGHQSGNITRDLDALMSRNPRLMLQTRKEGSSKQARKRYKLTREGIRAVEKMLSANQAGNETTTIS